MAADLTHAYVKQFGWIEPRIVGGQQKQQVCHSIQHRHGKAPGTTLVYPQELKVMLLQRTETSRLSHSQSPDISESDGEMKPFTLLILFLRRKVDSFHFEVMDTR